MNLNFKSTQIAATLACMLAVSGVVVAQETRATIRLSSQNQKIEQASSIEEDTPAIAPLPDANTMPLLRLATKGAMGGVDSGARSAEFTTDKSGDPNFGFSKRTAFTIKQGEMPIQQGAMISSAPCDCPPVQIGNIQLEAAKGPVGRALRDEFVCDGDDRGAPVTVDKNWNIYGMDLEDTFGHFDTIDGRRIVSPSNKVKIYSPRFAAVRRVDGVYNARRNARVGSFDRKLVMQTTRGKDFSSTTLQNTSPNNVESSKKASGFVDRTRGIVTDQAIELIGVRNSFSAYENLDLIKWGRHASSQTARLQLGMQSANAWTDNLRLQVHAKGAQPIIVNDLSSAQQVIHVESDGKGSVLRVTKIASKIAADVGEEVEFTIRFDNLSSKPVGNVTLVDNLTGRLQYIPGSAECSLKSKFVEKANEGGSLMLRWEITDPVKPFKGGIIRFKCRVH